MTTTPPTPLTASQTYQIWLDCPVFATKRRPDHADDFGDKKTIGLHLKLRSYNLQQTSWGEHPSPFAIYLGGDDERGYTIGYKEVLTFRLTNGITYPTLADLKSVWILD
jgi:hypothetical protein